MGLGEGLGIGNRLRHWGWIIVDWMRNWGLEIGRIGWWSGDDRLGMYVLGDLMGCGLLMR